MPKKIARLGDASDHGGAIITAASRTFAEGPAVARLGDLHSCPIPLHGVTPIVGACARAEAEGAQIAVDGSVTGCGAAIIAGSKRSFAE